MKVYLQNIRTGAYFQRYGKWIYDRENALNFQNVLDALDFAQNLQQLDLEVVLGLDDGQGDVRLSLGCVTATAPSPTMGLFSLA